MLNALVVLAAAEESHHEIDHALSWGIGVGFLVVLFGMLLALMAFGGGREHS
ncbi:hypothetical protein [Nocardioides marmotae]|uniref:hypothetical protein n=1 Tax=Nocardioides marmotae TaxID=2663857 RepID=UPI001495D334|nr:hypothetical protein [Nocardioides marmotae]MBC9733125.1 hypothetical protein [Nocardioides marmotae]QKE02189.1 hypothetical protein HPC71_14720 [Nocardioides marmotae]